ncbi:MAG: D-alanyl-D-alanine carboxypeptidase [Rhodobacteraceae bacterium HLUCCA12]|nr:MAG: D-alanyl-D-alanine carboxypeptidase [Rhodobacteraceae bacterium HLUCCA12]
MAARFWRSSRSGITVPALFFCAIVGVWLAPFGRVHAAPFAAVVMDARTGQILHATNQDTRLHPASLTKMMTLYVTFEAIQNGEISLDTEVLVSRRAATEVPSRLGLREGQRIRLRYLIRAAAIRSGNDAATAIAEAIGGSVEGFAARMNRTAAAIGMRNTTFRNAHGLTEAGHMSTARDMSILGRQLFFDFPQYYNLFSRRSEHAGIARVRNTNTRFLDSYPGADGIKTGFTNAAGYNLTAMAERNGVRVLATVFGGRSVIHRHQQVVELMNRGFREAPTRVALRRPPRPDYDGTTQLAGGQSEGRVVRYQTAPQRSPFPAPRPLLTPEQPSDQLLAALQSNISSVLADVAEPAEPEDEGAEDAGALAGALASSPLPPQRPGESGQDPAEAGLIAARAVGFGTIDPQEYLELTEGDGTVTPEDEEIVETALSSAPPRDRGAAADPADAPGADDPTLDTEAAIISAIAESLLDASSMPVLPPTEALLADIVIEDGLVIIPGLPPIAVDTAALSHPDTPITPVFADAEAVRATPEPAAGTRSADRDAMDSDAVEPDTAIGTGGGIMLTASDTDTAGDARGDTAPLPEIVTRVSTSGGRVFGVELGHYPSRFDAERTLLRVALSENGALGTGVRRVAQESAGYAAAIHSLTEEQAELACLRLTARSQPCEVVQP